jgi:hypothetical protein
LTFGRDGRMLALGGSKPVTIRKILTFGEQYLIEEGRACVPPLHKVAVAAICANPAAGRYLQDLSCLVDMSVEVGNRIASIAAEMMGNNGIESYGKGAIVGLGGSVEHAEAVLTTPFGDTMRNAAGGGKAWICHMAKRAGPGGSIDIPLAHKDALTIRSHYDAITITIPDAPLDSEIVIICCFANRGRPNHRIGGHSIENMIGQDGLR